MSQNLRTMDLFTILDSTVIDSAVSKKMISRTFLILANIVSVKDFFFKKPTQGLTIEKN